MLPFEWVGVLATGSGTFGALAETDEPTLDGTRHEEEPRPPLDRRAMTKVNHRA